MMDRYVPIRDAGGGPGSSRLKYNILNETQKELFQRTLQPTPLEVANYEQERRQVNTLLTFIDLKVNVAREDFPAINADIILHFQPYQATQAWQKFIADISKALRLEFIDCIVDRKDGAPIHRAMRLRQGGTYFARQRESSSILEILVTSVPPVQYIWEVTKDIAKVKEELEDGFKDQENITTRVKELINRPKHREEEKSIADAILQAEHPLDVVDAIDDLVHSTLVEKKELNEENQNELNNKVVPGDILSQRNKIITLKDVDHQKNPKLWHFDKSVDVVSLHRLALEHLNRMALIPKPHIEKEDNSDSDEESQEEIPSNAEIIVKDCLGFVLESIENFRYETDVNVIGLRFLADLIPHLGTERIKVMEALLNNIQIYAPERPDYRGPRIIPRIQPDRKPIEEPIEEAAETPKVREKKKKKVDEEDEDIEEEEKREKARIAWELEYKRQQEEEAKQKEEEEKRNMKPLRFIPKKRWSGMKGDLLKPPEKKPDNPFLKIKKTKEEKKEKVKVEPVVRSRKKLQVAMKGLPVVPGISFRGFPKLMKRNMILVQSFATLFKLIEFSYPNRDAAFSLSLHLEIAEIGQVCQSMPQVLEYILWIINCMYRDGFNTGGEDANDLDSVIPSMQVTETMPTKDHDDDNQSIDPITGKIIDAVSSLSGVSVTMEDIKTDTPRVNKGDPNKHYEELPEFWDRPADFYMKGDGKSNVTGKDLEDIEPLPAKIPDTTNDRYNEMPGDDVLITLGMISYHLDLHEDDRGLAHKWLTHWDDNSPNFKKMVQKGINLIDL